MAKDEKKGDPQPGPEEVEPAKRRKRKRKRKVKDDATKENTDEHADLITIAQQEGDNNTVFCNPLKATNEMDRTIYVEGIPFTAQPDDVMQFFRKGIETENPQDLIVDCRLPVWHDSGRLRGYGHIVLDTNEHYKAALNLSGKYLHNRYLKIEPANQPKDLHATVPTSEPSNKIMLHNLAYDANEEDVQAVMEAYGTIAKGGVRIVRHSGTNQSKGFAYVEYTDMASARKAAASLIQIKGRPCRLDYDHGRVRGSFRTADRKLWQKEYGVGSSKTRANEDDHEDV